MRHLALSLIALTTIAATAMAQGRANTRQGFWIGVGLGAGSAGVECTSCSDDRSTGFSGNLKLGGTLSPKFLLGGETNGWLHSESGVNETLGFGSIVGVWYPSATGAFFLKLGLGGMTYRAEFGIDEIVATAGAGSLGLGYDIRVTTNMSFTLWLNSLASAPASFEFNGVTVPTDDISINLLQIGAALTWH